MEKRTLKNVSNCLNTHIYCYLETSGSQSFNLNLNVVLFLNTSISKTSVTAEDSCFPALVSNTCCSITFTTKTDQSKVVNLAQTTFRFSPVSFHAPCS